MKPIALIAVAAITSAATSFLVHTALGADAKPAESTLAAPSSDDAGLAGLRTEVGALARSLEQHRMAMDSRFEQLARQPVAAASQPESPAAELSLVADAGPTAAAPADGARANLPAEDLFELLRSGQLSGLEEEELWNELSKLGRTKELIALFEARAAQQPNDPAVQVELGGAYLRMLQEVGQSALAGVWAGKADGAFNRALEIDPLHVEARLTKAISLSFWPPILGKQGEAVKQFETLISQLENQNPSPDTAQAWLMLGNLHQQMGKPDQALSVWQQGASLFPGNPEFAAKLKP
ncbi:MAG: hypothetical protein GC161_02835 [Planctomycetaceae bacterium]|nr:hypothetical protein [Planctomycetaceae bacterium]